MTSIVWKAITSLLTKPMQFTIDLLELSINAYVY